MLSPLNTLNELDRLKDLESYRIMDTEEEEDFDRLTELASEICGTKISLVSLLDDKRQWFKSRKGLAATETPKEISFCGHAIHRADRPFIVENAKEDERFHDNPLVTDDPNIAFYAGMPLVSESGNPLGTLCVIHDQPKKLSDKQIRSLETLAKQTMKLIELRKKSRELERTNELLLEQNEKVALFSTMAAHDLKSPLGNIASLVELVLEDKSLDEETLEYIELIQESSNQMLKLIKDLLAYSQAEKVDPTQQENFLLEELTTELNSLLPNHHPYDLQIEGELNDLETNRAALKMILLNLLSNSIKYNDKEKAEIILRATLEKGYYQFEVEDNGPGIELNYHKELFQPFTTLNSKDNKGEKGSGLGLAAVQKTLKALDGDIKLDPLKLSGAKFIFKIPSQASL